MAVQEELRIGWERVHRLVDQPVQLKPIAIINADRLAVQLGVELPQQVLVYKPRLLLEVPFIVVDPLFVFVHLPEHLLVGRLGARSLRTTNVRQNNLGFREDVNRLQLIVDRIEPEPEVCLRERF